jgi:hypothetical protein
MGHLTWMVLRARPVAPGAAEAKRRPLSLVLLCNVP